MSEPTEERAPLTEAELLEMETRERAASPGPFQVIPPDASRRAYDLCRVPGCGDVPPENFFIGVVYEGPRDAADADFLAHARQDVPRLLAEVRRLRAGLREACDRWEERAAAMEHETNGGGFDGERAVRAEVAAFRERYGLV